MLEKLLLPDPAFPRSSCRLDQIDTERYGFFGMLLLGNNLQNQLCVPPEARQLQVMPHPADPDTVPVLPCYKRKPTLPLPFLRNPDTQQFAVPDVTFPDPQK